MLFDGEIKYPKTCSQMDSHLISIVLQKCKNLKDLQNDYLKLFLPV